MLCSRYGTYTVYHHFPTLDAFLRETAGEDAIHGASWSIRLMANGNLLGINYFYVDVIGILTDGTYPAATIQDHTVLHYVLVMFQVQNQSHVAAA